MLRENLTYTPNVYRVCQSTHIAALLQIETIIHSANNTGKFKFVFHFQINISIYIHIHVYCICMGIESSDSCLVCPKPYTTYVLYV